MNAALYEWRTHGAQHCPACADLQGLRLTMEAWQALILPGFHAGCDCALVLVTTTAPPSQAALKPLPPGKRFGGSATTSPRRHFDSAQCKLGERVNRTVADSHGR